MSLDTIVHVHAFPTARPGVAFARESYQALGGTSAGKALNLAALGCRVTLAAQCGQDAAGDFVRGRLRGADVHLMELLEERTEQHVNLMNAQGERLSIFTVMRVFNPSVEVETFRSVMEGADAVMLDIINWSRSLIPLAQALGKPIWCDLHDYDGHNPYHQAYLEAANYVFFSSEAIPDWRAWMPRLIEQGKTLVVATHGAHGATLLSGRGEWLEVAAVQDIEVTDTNGAGDAFLSGFFFAHQRGGSLEQSLDAARRVAALCVQSRELVAPDLTPTFLG